MDSFNIPNYSPSPTEVKCEVEKEESFTIDGLGPSDASKDGRYNLAKTMRAVYEALLVSHLGDGILIDEVFSRYRMIVADHMSKEKTEFIKNVTVP